MKNIWHVQWYNEDAYGITQQLYVIIQGDNLTQEDAKVKAKKHLKKVLSLTPLAFNKYEHFKATDVTDKEILTADYIHIC